MKLTSQERLFVGNFDMITRIVVVWVLWTSLQFLLDTGGLHFANVVPGDASESGTHYVCTTFNSVVRGNVQGDDQLVSPVLSAGNDHWPLTTQNRRRRCGMLNSIEIPRWCVAYNRYLQISPLRLARRVRIVGDWGSTFNYFLPPPPIKLSFCTMGVGNNHINWRKYPSHVSPLTRYKIFQNSHSDNTLLPDVPLLYTADYDCVKKREEKFRMNVKRPVA